MFIQKMGQTCAFCFPHLCRRAIEQQLGSIILATDISRQNEFLLSFREHLDSQDLDLQLASHRHFLLQVELLSTSQYANFAGNVDPYVRCPFFFYCHQIALKCADVCNPCRDWELSRQWGERVCEEFYRQGEKMPQSLKQIFISLSGSNTSCI